LFVLGQAVHFLGLHNFDLAISAGQALVAYAVTERTRDRIRLASSGGEVVVKPPVTEM
jgi:hypothetical protein